MELCQTSAVMPIFRPSAWVVLSETLGRNLVEAGRFQTLADRLELDPVVMDLLTRRESPVTLGLENV